LVPIFVRKYEFGPLIFKSVIQVPNFDILYQLNPFRLNGRNGVNSTVTWIYSYIILKRVIDW